MASSYTPREQQYYNQLFDIVDKEQLGVLTGENSINFLLASKLPQHTLGEIWALADPNNTGYLTKDGWWKACRLIGWCQKGETVKEELGARAGPFPTFEGYPPPPTANSTPGSNFMTPQTTGTPSGGGTGAPALTPAEKTQYTRIFVGVPPEGGLISGPKAQAIFMKSKLPYDKLAQIWNLADTQQRGSLDLPDFIIGMYYIQALMSGSIKELPSSLPMGIYESASGGRSRPPNAPTSPIPRQMTGGSPAPGAGPTRQMTTGGMPSGMLQPQGTGQSFSGSPARQFSTPPTSIPPATGAFGNAFSPFGGNRQQSQEQWDVSQQEKKTADGFFDGMDTTRRGFIEGDVAVPFMLQSGLDEDTLAQVWDLADIRKEGKLTREEFAVAMHLINDKLAGKPLPSTLPMSTVPPGLRSQVAAQSGTGQPTRDLLDVFGDSPPATATPPQQPSYFSSPPSQARSPPPMLPQGTGASTSSGPAKWGPPASAIPAAASGFGVAPFAPVPPPSRNATARQPSQNLMGDDEETSRGVPDNSADVGNARNALDSTSRSVTSLQGEKESLERSVKSSSAELHELEMRLSSVRAQHETETRLVKDLKTRTAEQKEKLNTLRDDLIRNESELSALRAEKDEIEQTLLQDKEEVRNLGKRMKEVTEETNILKDVLEKMKKEARQQKGMVAISKKQVSTLEGGKDIVQKEMDKVAASQHEDPIEELASPFAERAISPTISPAVAMAAAIPLPSTPQRVISPNPTGVSQKSNNPFDRFNRQPSSLPSSPPQLPRSSVKEHEGLSGSQKGFLGVGGAIAAGALAAGSAVTASVVGAGTALVSAIAPTEEHNTEELDLKAEPAAEEIQTAETPAGGRDAADPFGVPASTEETTETPVANVHEEDPFGMQSFDKTPEPHKVNEFSSSFGDSFDDSFTSPSAPTVISAHPPANGADFDSAFREFEEPPAAPPATLEMPTIPHPPMPERTASTQAIPPSSEVHTPVSEMPSTGLSTPRAAVEESPAPVNVEALQPHPAAEPTEATTPHHEVDSSDDEDEGPEDLDQERYAFGGPAREEDAAFVPPQQISKEQSSELPSLQTLALGPVLPAHLDAVPSAPEDRAAIGTLQDNEIAPMPPAAPALAIAPTSPVTPVTRREPPPPPLGSRSAPTSQAQAQSQPQSQPQPQPTNPFSLFTGNNAPTPTSATQPQQQPSTTSFDDDDFDFENLPSATVATGEVPAPSGFTPHTQQASKDFDSEFDDFSPDFEMVEPPSSNGGGLGNNQQSGVGMGSALGMLGGLGGLGESAHTEQRGHSSTSGTTGFDDEDWANLPTAGGQGQSQSQSVGQQEISTAGGFSFDDAFGGDFTPAPFTTGTTETKPSEAGQTYAPPPGPPPGIRESYDHPPPKPDLPSRPSMSRAQPDDLEDVKKLCGMGFDRDLVISALEANDYNLQKTLNVLLPGK